MNQIYLVYLVILSIALSLLCLVGIAGIARVLHRAGLSSLLSQNLRENLLNPPVPPSGSEHSDAQSRPGLSRIRSLLGRDKYTVTLPFEYTPDPDSLEWEATIDPRVAALERAVEYNNSYNIEPDDSDEDLSTYKEIS